MNPETKERLEMLQKHARSLELDLAQTKLKLVESECKVQVSNLNYISRGCGVCSLLYLKTYGYKS